MSTKSVSCLLVNIRSLRRNLNEFVCTLEAIHVKPEILVLTEIWIYTHEIELYNILGYRSYFACQDSGAAGGVAVYVRDDLTSCIVDVYLKNVEACIVDVQIEGKWLRVTGVYRSPNRAFSNLAEFLAADLTNVLSPKSATPLEKLFVGDLNIDISKRGTNVEHYLNLLAEHGYESLETGITRAGRADGHGTIIDHAFIRPINIIETSTTILNMGNELDHKTVKVNLVFQTKITNRHQEQNRIHWPRFNSIFSEQDFSKFYSQQDSSSACRTLYTIISKCKKEATRVPKTGRKHQPLKPWVTQDILKCIKIRNNLKRLCDKYPDIEALVQKYKRYRNKLKEMIRQAEETYIKRAVEHTDNPRDAWQVINNDVRGKSRKKILPTALTENTEGCRKALDQCNQYFAEIGKKLAESNGAICNEAIHTYPAETKLSEFVAPDVSAIQAKIDRLENGKAPGWDELRAETLKLNPQLYAKILWHLVGLIFTTGHYPKELKNASVVLIHKGGDPENISNYRPISLLSILNKIVEEIMVDQLKNHLEVNRILVEHQYGFRSGRGTQQAVCCLQTCIQEALENNEYPVVVFLDYSRAFDTVPRERLLAKLAGMAIEDKALRLLGSYLQERTQRIKIGSNISDEIAVNYGVPQGGTIAPILFTIYINDLLFNKKSYETRIGYADDTCIVLRFKNMVCKKSIEETLQEIQRWSSLNGLVLNHKKSKYVTFGDQTVRFRNPVKVHYCEQCMNNTECTCPSIKNATNVDYLGMMLDERLTWSMHVEKLKPKLRAAIACISKIRKSVGLTTSKLIYSALFESHLRYGLLAYGTAFPTVLKPLETLQNVCLRRMLRANPLESAETLYPRAGALALKKIFLQSILLNYNVRESNLGVQLRQQYRIGHAHQTRAMSAEKIDPPRHRLERTRRLHKNHYLLILNNLPPEIRDNTKLKISDRKSIIRDFIRGLSTENLKQFLNPHCFLTEKTYKIY